MSSFPYFPCVRCNRTHTTEPCPRRDEVTCLCLPSGRLYDACPVHGDEEGED